MSNIETIKHNLNNRTFKNEEKNLFQKYLKNKR